MMQNNNQRMWLHAKGLHLCHHPRLPCISSPYYIHLYIVDSKMSPALGLKKNAIQPLPGVNQNALKLSGIVCSNTFKYIQIICSMHNHLPILIGHEGHPAVGHLYWWRSTKWMGLIRIDSRNLDLHCYIPYQLGSRHINRLWFCFG